METTFQIQNTDGSLSSVSHEIFYEILNGEVGYLYYTQGGKHIAMLPTVINAESVRICRQTENAENNPLAKDLRCRDEKGRLCRYQHDEAGRVIRNEAGNPVSAKCGDCPRNGWTAGKRENCCIRNYCKVSDCTYCPHPRESHAPLSLERFFEDELDGTGFSLADPQADIQANLEKNELYSALYDAIDRLPPNERSVIKALHWGNISQREYGIQNGMSKSAVNRLYIRSLKTLKTILKDFQ